MLCGVDDILDYRRQDQTGSWPVGHAIRFAGRDTCTDRVHQPHLSRCVDRTVRRTLDVSAADAGHRRGRVAADFRPDL